MNETPKKRAWFQLHLGTCVVLMVVAGALAGANLTPEITTDPVNPVEKMMRVSEGEVVPEFKIRYTHYGWPWTLHQSTEWSDGFIDVEWVQAHYFRDSCVWLAILLASAISCEALLRRRERRRLEKATAPQPASVTGKAWPAGP